MGSSHLPRRGRTTICVCFSVAHCGFCAQFGISNQRRLAVLEHQLYAFLGKTADAAFCVNEAGRVCFWSACAERFLGWSQKKALHNSCCSLLQSRDTLGAPTLTELSTRGNSQESPGGFPISTWKSRPPVGEGCGSIYPAYCSRILRLISGWWRTSLVISQR